MALASPVIALSGKGQGKRMPYQNSQFDTGYDIQAITFDAVGTLIVPYPSVGEIYSEELARLGCNLSPDFLGNKFIGAFRQFKRYHPDSPLDRDSWRAIVAKALKGLTPEDTFDLQFEALWHAFRQPERWRILPGVESTLQDLQMAGVRLFVLSNNDERLPSILKGLGIGRYFEAIFVSAELGAEKPSARIFQLVQERIKLDPKRILHVGDNPVEDVQGALAAGWHAALIGAGIETPDDMPAVGRAGSIRELFSKE